MTKTLMTLTFLRQDDKILLGLKKRGFGEGRWNGFGGKVADGESVENAATRELFEEVGIQALTLEKRAIHNFISQRRLGETLEVHTFLVTEWQGTLVETEEMRPQWFTLNDIPYATMWPDDIYWLPLFLEGKKLRTKFLFGAGDMVLTHTITEVENV